MNNQNKSHHIKELRKRLGLGRTEFANLLGLGSAGERTVRGWEEGEHTPSSAKWQAILAVEKQMTEYLQNAPFRQQPACESKFTFIDLFAGIGGIRLPYQRLGGQCVFSSEWDKFSQKTYLTNFGEMPHGDITKIKATDIPDHDILLGGFPCQAFSQAGLKKGFSDTRGTMFFEIQRILATKRPKSFMLENVKQLQGHDKGRTLKTILDILRGQSAHSIPDDIPISEDARTALSEKLNYWVDYKVLRAGDFGAPQNRERIFIVGFDKDYFDGVDFDNIFNWPKPPMTPTKVGDILEDLSNISEFDDRYTISDKLWNGHQKRKLEHEKKGNGFGYSLFNENSEYTNTISARYYKDGSEILIDQSHLNKNPRKLTPRECARLQGFPDNYIVDAVSQGQIYKQFGNSVCINVIDAVAKELVSTISEAEKVRVSNIKMKKTVG
ncbi:MULTISPECIES: DNA (cytosine-5-)-methyltransferase [Citrobacter]|uniref:DNA (cytosine-5-)-methyltransferase n=1 Tax=Citrobacter TaxID=544 RepID=UPI000500AB0D|nr:MULTISPECIES: DNA (cytosine-5-)-methyltransferase [Citrobacter]TKU78329.1 DNA (cytosine-5-)-methyltransferase [Citrobacter sp. wls706]UCA24345.1 DNA (cytosine-5-)-methyltransferase [Citrobacter werkmanii]GAL46721.1 putative DNA-cytosine methyltransferase [Citrobacter werkmanii NBRC 105721]HAT7570049.1 DNA (cytosine-5-)-methyltransferase [Citrobacter werkmanii]